LPETTNARSGNENSNHENARLVLVASTGKLLLAHCHSPTNQPTNQLPYNDTSIKAAKRSFTNPVV